MAYTNPPATRLTDGWLKAEVDIAQNNQDDNNNTCACTFLLLLLALVLLMRSYDHALDPESGSVGEVGGRHQVFMGAPKLVQSQRCPNWPVLKSGFFLRALKSRGRVCVFKVSWVFCFFTATGCFFFVFNEKKILTTFVYLYKKILVQSI